MPKKYRQPAAKRRKSKSTTIPYDFEGSPAVADTDDRALDDDAPLLAVDVADPESEPEDRPMSNVGGGARATKHVARDYSYVRGEIVRIAAIATFLVVALLITSVLRN